MIKQQGVERLWEHAGSHVHPKGMAGSLGDTQSCCCGQGEADELLESGSLAPSLLPKAELCFSDFNVNLLLQM